MIRLIRFLHREKISILMECKEGKEDQRPLADHWEVEARLSRASIVNGDFEFGAVLLKLKFQGILVFTILCNINLCNL